MSLDAKVEKADALWDEAINLSTACHALSRIKSKEIIKADKAFRSALEKAKAAERDLWQDLCPLCRIRRLLSTSDLASLAMTGWCNDLLAEAAGVKDPTDSEHVHPAESAPTVH